MNKPKHFCLYFRLRYDNYSTYRQINLRLRVAGEKNYIAIGTGLYIEESQWRPRYRRRHQPGFVSNEALEAKLDAIQEKVEKICRYQTTRADVDGSLVTARTIIEQYRALSAPSTPVHSFVSISPQLIARL